MRQRLKKSRKEDKSKGGVVLVIDDDPNDCLLFQRALSREGYQVHEAYSGNEALDVLEKENVQLALLDIVMPGRGGISTLEEIRNRWPELPVIVLTGYGTENTARQAMLMGAYDYFTKPFDLAIITKTIQRALAELDARKRFGS